jgi:small-conductance mechanosensitive channel
MTDLLHTEWFIWGIGLILGFQVMVVVLGEAIYRADRKGHPLSSIYRAARNGVLPLLVFYVFLSKIVGLEADSVVMRAIATLFWISVIYAVLLFVNVLLFAQAAPGTWRARAPKLFQDMVRVSLVVIGAAIVLSVVWRRDLGGLVAALGVGSIVLGLALQETLGNLMAGIAMLFERPFSIGDWVKVGNNAGEVVQINWRSVHLRTIDRNLLVIPNSALGRETFTNFSAPTRLQTLRLKFAFSLDVPPNQVKDMLIDVARNTPYVADDPEPKAHAVEFGEDRIHYQAVLCLEFPKMYRKLIDAYTTRVWYAAQRTGLQLPLPREVLEHKIAGEVESRAHIDTHIARLENVAVLKGLSHEQLETLAGHVDINWFSKGETILNEGQMSEAVYVIESGVARVLHQGDAGGSTEVLQLGEGELFGESALNRGQPNPDSVVATTDLELLRIPLADLESLFESSPQTARQFANLIDIRADATRRIVGDKS